MIFGIYTTSDISKLLYVISWAVRRVKFETMLKYHKWYLCQLSRTNYAIICLYYYPQKVCWNTTALSQSNCRNFSCGSINYWGKWRTAPPTNSRPTVGQQSADLVESPCQIPESLSLQGRTLHIDAKWNFLTWVRLIVCVFLGTNLLAISYVQVF